MAGIFYGIKPAVAAIVLQAAHRIGSRALKMAPTGPSPPLPLSLFCAERSFSADRPRRGTGGFYRRTAGADDIRQSGRPPCAESPGGAAIIDDTTPIPAHAIFSWRRTSQVLIAGMLLWLVPMAALTLMLGWAHPLTQMSWFFTKAALMTFGGAYAVLPYVYRGR